jgi:predicted esterase
MALERSLVFAAALAAVAGRSASARDVEAREPSEKNRGAVYSWKWADNLPYEYFVPKEYDAKVGANLVLVLHGNGLDYRWTFANHDAGKFRRDDIVVSPEGTTWSENTKSHEFFAGKENVDKLHELIAALKKAFKVRQTFLYGHSQGSFFVFEYAGMRPDDVDGVLGQSGALWNSSPVGSFGHKQAIALMHGTDDANVPYGQSVYGRDHYREAGYPMAHLRTLWGWPHAPIADQAELELSWCEGMTSGDPARVEKCLAALLAKAVKGGLDPAALDAVAARLEKMGGASPAAVAAAKAARGRVAKAAADVVAAIEKSLGKGKLSKLDGKEWHGLLVRFLEDFDGVPAAETFTKAHAADLAAHAKVAEKALGEIRANRDKDRAKAALAAADLLESGFTSAYAAEVAADLGNWLKDGKSLKLAKKDAARLEALVEQYQKSRKEGAEAYAKLIKDLAD